MVSSRCLIRWYATATPVLSPRSTATMKPMAPGTRRLLRWLSSLAVLGACGAGGYAVCARLPLFDRPPLPPLLAGAGAGFGNWSGCAHGDGVSPDLEQRLRTQFPAGSPAAALVAALSAQDFSAPTLCGPYATTRFACYTGPTDSSTGKPTRPDVDACIYWDADDSGRLLWTRGYLHFISL
jgi:hypothetical protein